MFVSLRLPYHYRHDAMQQHRRSGCCCPSVNSNQQATTTSLERTGIHFTTCLMIHQGKNETMTFRALNDYFQLFRSIDSCFLPCSLMPTLKASLMPAIFAGLAIQRASRFMTLSQPINLLVRGWRWCFLLIIVFYAYVSLIGVLFVWKKAIREWHNRQTEFC